MATFTEMKGWKTEGHAQGIAEGMAMGMLEARRADLIRVLRLRFPDAPYEITESIRVMRDLDQLTRWFDSSVVAPSIDMFKIMALDADSQASRRAERKPF